MTWEVITRFYVLVSDFPLLIFFCIVDGELAACHYKLDSWKHNQPIILGNTDHLASCGLLLSGVCDVTLQNHKACKFVCGRGGEVCGPSCPCKRLCHHDRSVLSRHSCLVVSNAVTL